MARSRSFKPELLIDERLVACSMAARWLYVGMGTEADRDGRLEDRPLRLKLAVLPGDAVEVEPLLGELADRGLILRYTIAGKRYIQILDWDKLQSPHIKEPTSTIPAPASASTDPAPTEPVQAPDTHQTSTLPAALTSDSGPLTLDLGPLTTDPCSSPDLPTEGTAGGASLGRKKAGKEKSPLVTAETWQAYSAAWEARYGAAPVRNATVNGQLSNLVKQLGATDSPAVAAFFVSRDEPFYVTKCHPVGLLLNDAQKLRMEWATGKANGSLNGQALTSRQRAAAAVMAPFQRKPSDDGRTVDAEVVPLRTNARGAVHSGFDRLDYSAGVGPNGELL